MANISATVTIATIGTDAGPFTVTDSVANTYTGVSRAALLAGYTNTFDDTATNITVTSTGVCTNNIVIPFVLPSPTPMPSPTPTPGVVVRLRAAVNAISISNSTFIIANNTPGGTIDTIVANSVGVNGKNDAFILNNGIITAVQYFVDKDPAGFGIATDPSSVILQVNGTTRQTFNFNTGDVISAAFAPENLVSTDVVQIFIQEG